MREAPDTPLWARALDVLTVALVAAAVYIFFFGGIHATVLGVRVLIKSPTRALRRAVVVALVRHVFHRRPSLPERIAAGVGRVRPTWQQWDRRWPVAFTLVPLALASRLLMLAVGWAAVLTVGYAPGAPPFRLSANELVNLPVRWDAGWYLGLIIDGYSWPERVRSQANVAFFPAYPWLVRAVGLFQFDRASSAAAAWVAVAVSVALFACALWYVHRLALRVGTQETATAAVGLLATYPFALFFSVPYTESLFLLVTAAAMYHLSSGRPWPAAAFAFVAGLSRPNGVLLAVPLGLMAWRQLWVAWRAEGEAGVRSGLSRLAGRSWPAWVAVAAPGLGVLAYSSLCWWHTGHPFLWLQVQSVGWNRASTQVWPLLDEVHRMVVPGLEATWEWSPYDIFNLLATGLALLAVWPVSRRVGPELGAYVAISVAVPLAYGGLMSLGRFTSVLFPVFIWLGLALGRRGREATTLVFVAGQALLAVLFFTWRPLF